MLNGKDSPPEVRGTTRRAPHTSIVVAWRGATKDLESLLLELSTECEATGVELVLAHSSTASHRARLRRLFPSIHIAQAPPDTSLAHLRQLGAQTASGDILIFVDNVTGSEARVVSSLSAVDESAASPGPVQRQDAQLVRRAETRDTALG